MKTCVLVTGHFPPSNLVGAQRMRYWAKYLPEFGWTPIILTTHYRYYEEILDWDLHRMLSSKLEIISTPALPTQPIRIIGDIGIRAFPWHLYAIWCLIKSRKIDFLHITIQSNYLAPLGRIVKRLTGIPYGIDYQDPWLCDGGGLKPKWSKAWGSYHLAKILEPWAVKHASAITAVAEGYYRGVLERHPYLRQQAAINSMPFGAEATDFTCAQNLNTHPPLWENNGCFHGIYAGALLPKAIRPLEALFTAVAYLKKKDPNLSQRFQLHFIGTGAHPNNPNGHQVLPRAERANVADLITEHPHRIPYLQVLTHLRRADGVLILGSTESHYSPSKIFQAIQSDKPIVALLHEASPAVDYLLKVGGASIHTMNEIEGPDIAKLSNQLTRWIRREIEVPPDRASKIPEEQTSRYSARMLAETMNKALELTTKNN